MTYMVHLHWLRGITDTTRLAQFGTSSHFDAPLEQLDVRVVDLKAVSPLFPVFVEKECDVAISLPILCFDSNRERCPEFAEHLFH